MSKKWIIVIAVLVVAVLAGYIVAASGLFESSEEKAIDQIAPKVQSAKSAPEIVYTLKTDGLRVDAKIVTDDWERGVLDISVKVINEGDGMLMTAKLVATTISQSGARSTASGVSVNRLKAGESVALPTWNLEVMGTSNIKKVELSFQGVIWEPGSTITPPTAASPTPTQTTSTPAGKIYTAAPKDPVTPEDVAAAFFFLCDQREYTKAESFVTRDFVRANESVQELWAHISGGKKLASAQVVDIYISSDSVRVKMSLRFNNGRSFESNPSLAREAGGWKLIN